MTNLMIINVVLFGLNFLCSLINSIKSEEKRGWIVATGGWLVAFIMQLDKIL